MRKGLKHFTTEYQLNTKEDSHAENEGEKPVKGIENNQMTEANPFFSVFH